MGWLVHIAGDARELRMKKRRAEPESDMVERKKEERSAGM